MKGPTELRLTELKERVAECVANNIRSGANSYTTSALMAELHIAADDKDQSDAFHKEIDYLRKALWTTVPRSNQMDFMNHLVEVEEAMRNPK